MKTGRFTGDAAGAKVCRRCGSWKRVGLGLGLLLLGCPWTPNTRAASVTLQHGLVAYDQAADAYLDEGYETLN